MTWKNILSVVPNEKIKFITKMLSVISFCSTKWIDLCREKSLGRCIPTPSLCLFFV